MKPKFYPFIRSAVSAVSLAIANDAQATILYWDGNGATDATYQTINSWATTLAGGTDPAGAPGIGDDAVFSISSITTARAANLQSSVQKVNSWTFNGNGAFNFYARNGVRTFTIGAGGITLNSGAGAVTINGPGTNGSALTMLLNAGQTWTNNSSNALTFSSNYAGSKIDTNGKALVIGGTGNTIINQLVTGGGSLEFNGSGSAALTLSVASDYTGLTKVSAGALNIGSGGSLNSGNALTIGASGKADFANAGQTLGAVDNANTTTNALNFSASTGTVTLASLTGAGNTRFGSAGTVTGGISSGTVSAVGLLTSDIGGGTVGAGSLSSNSISSGTTTVGGVANIGTISGGTANLNGATSTINTFNGGTVNLGASSVLTVNAGTSAGSISGSGALTKTGGSTLTLSGDNSYSGATAINNGTLAVTGSGDINSTSGVTIASGATFRYNSSVAYSGGAITNNDGTITGTGNIGVAVTLDSLADKLAPGNSPGIQNYGVGQSWSSFTYQWETNNFTGTTAGTDFDQLGINGSLTLTGAAANSYALDILSLTGSNASGLVPNFAETSRQWTILTASGGITGFNAAYWNILTSGFTSSPTWTGNFSVTADSNNIYLNYAAVPEPRAALLGGLGLFALLRRRRS